MATADPMNRSTFTMAPVTGPSGPLTVPTMRAFPGPMVLARVVTVRGVPRATVVSGTVGGGAVVTSMTPVVGGVVVDGVGSSSDPPPHEVATTAATTRRMSLRTALLTRQTASGHEGEDEDLGRAVPSAQRSSTSAGGSTARRT